MKFIAYDKNKIETRGYQRSDNLKLLEGFAESGLECAKVEDWTQKNAFICAGSLQHSIKRYRMNNLRCVTRSGEVFLIRTEK